MLILTHSYPVAEWSNACPALKDFREFKTSIFLWLLRAWVQILIVVIFSDNQRLIQIVTLCLLFSKKLPRHCAFMPLEQLHQSIMTGACYKNHHAFIKEIESSKYVN